MRQGGRAAPHPRRLPACPSPLRRAAAVCDMRLLEAVSQKHLLKSRPSVLLAECQAEGISRGMQTETSFRSGRPAWTRGFRGCQKAGRPEPQAPIPGSQPRSRVQAPGRAGPTVCVNASFWVREDAGLSGNRQESRGTRVPSACNRKALTRPVRGDLE